jgi:hypothetical protein
MKRYFIAAAAITLLLALAAAEPAESGEGGYHSPKEIEKSLKSLVKKHGDYAQLHTLSESPGGRDVLLLELLAAEQPDAAPAILVVANMTGDCPIATEAALRLADSLAGGWRDELEVYTWYIVPVGNPDGHARFFAKPLDERFTNERPFNDDNDGATDEDGPDDLNGDGYITVMRQEHPEGRWIPIDGNPVLMKTAEAAKGEHGRYRLFTEGIDDDGDGEINEDGPGGVNPGRNFPHNFEHYTKTCGPWAASEEESRSVMRFAFDHPEIALILAFGRSNSLKSVPEGSKKTERTQDKYKVPKRMAERMGIDPNEEFTMTDLVEMARDYTGYQDIDEDMVLMFLGVGAAVNPDRRDVPYWSEISERYNEFIKSAGLDGERLDPAPFPPGSIEEWGYFQYGVPSFGVDFWTLPVKKREKEKKEGALTPEEVEKMSNEEFAALGRERIGEFLAASDAPAHFTPDMVIMGLKGGMVTTKKIAEFMRKAEKKKPGGADETDQALYDFDAGAFLEWRPFDHPTLGDVEIGGRIPYAALAPPPGVADSVIDAQLPFVRVIAKMLPRVAIEKVRVEQRGVDIWKIDAWVVNNGFLPYPTHQGGRCRRPSPVAIEVDGDGVEMLEGRGRIVVGLLEGSGGFKKVTWVIRAAEGTRVKLAARSFSAGGDLKDVVLTEGGGE